MSKNKSNRTIYQHNDSAHINRRLIKEVSNTLNVFRSLLSDDRKLCMSIDESYEELLLDSLQAVPEQYDQQILDTLDVVKIFLNNINFAKVSDELTKRGKHNVRFNIDSFKLFESGIGKLDMNARDKARMLNIATKFKPIFDCVNALLNKPVDLVRKLGATRDDSLSDLFM